MNPLGPYRIPIGPSGFPIGFAMMTMLLMLLLLMWLLLLLLCVIMMLMMMMVMTHRSNKSRSYTVQVGSKATSSKRPERTATCIMTKPTTHRH